MVSRNFEVISRNSHGCESEKSFSLIFFHSVPVSRTIVKTLRERIRGW